MNDDKRSSSLQKALGFLAEETADVRPPADLERRLKAQVRRSRVVAMRPWWMVAAAAALVAVGFWAVSTKRTPEPGPVVAVVQPQVVERVAAPAPEAPVPEATPAVLRASVSSRPNELRSELRPVTPWFYSDGLPRPAGGQLVLIRVSAATASRFGVVSDRPVPAQLLIGDDGLTRAIRFVQSEKFE